MLGNLVPKGKQFEIMDLEMKGHNVVTGSAGAGKSTCALWRAKALVNTLNEEVCLLTYNNTLSNYLSNIIGSDKEKVNITTFHKIATGYLRSIGRLSNDEIVGNKGKIIKSAIEEVKRSIGVNSTLVRESFIEEEISWMQKVGCLNLNEYENIVRHGRGNAKLDRVNRKYVFMVYEKYLELRARRGFVYDWDDIAYYANQFLITDEPKKVIKHVIIDEGQDFSPMMIKFLVNYVGDDGTVMYLGDAAQQIYGSNGTWKSSGLKIRKAYKLDQNYRNSYEIEVFANEIRNGLVLDDQEVLRSENGVESLVLPKVIKVKEEGKEKRVLEEIVKNTLKKLNNQLRRSIAILTVTNDGRDEVADLFRRKGIGFSMIDKYDRTFKGDSGFYIGTYHAAKGLEFDNVLLYKCSEVDFNCEVSGDEDKNENLEKALKLLYVGVTRAKKKVILVYNGNLPQGFPKNKVMTNGKELYEYREI